MEIYSHSRLSTFEQCPLKYKLRYIDKIIPEIKKTIEAHLGSSVHDTLEWVYNSVKENPDKILSLDEVVNYYLVLWEKNLTDDILIVKKHLTQNHYLNKGIEYLANYYQKNFPFKDGTIECEKEILIVLDENTKIKGFIDRLVYDIENNRYEIHDYKTANSLPSQENMDKDRQLALYSIAIKEVYGEEKEVLLIWHYLAHNHKIVSKRTNEQLKNLKEETKKLIKEIQNTKEFLSNKSILCEWCEYKSLCPEWNPKTNTDTSKKILPKKVNPFKGFDNQVSVDKKENLDIWN